MHHFCQMSSESGNFCYRYRVTHEQERIQTPKSFRVLCSTSMTFRQLLFIWVILLCQNRFFKKYIFMDCNLWFFFCMLLCIRSFGYVHLFAEQNEIFELNFHILPESGCIPNFLPIKSSFYNPVKTVRNKKIFGTSKV